MKQKIQLFNLYNLHPSSPFFFLSLIFFLLQKFFLHSWVKGKHYPSWVLNGWGLFFHLVSGGGWWWSCKCGGGGERSGPPPTERIFHVEHGPYDGGGKFFWETFFIFLFTFPFPFFFFLRMLKWRWWKIFGSNSFFRVFFFWVAELIVTRVCLSVCTIDHGIWSIWLLCTYLTCLPTEFRGFLPRFSWTSASPFALFFFVV